MKKLALFLLIISVFWHSTSANADHVLSVDACYNIVKKQQLAINSEEWQQWRKNHKYSVSYVKVDNQLIKIKASIAIDINVEGFLNILHDVTSIPNWMPQAISADIKKLSTNHNVLSLQFAEIWPVGPRELVIESYISHCAPYHFIKVLNVDRNASNPNIIKMQLIEGFWIIQQISPESIHVNYVSTVDPKGDIPQWIAQKVALRNIWQTLDNLNKLSKTNYN